MVLFNEKCKNIQFTPFSLIYPPIFFKIVKLRENTTVKLTFLHEKLRTNCIFLHFSLKMTVGTLYFSMATKATYFDDIFSELSSIILQNNETPRDYHGEPDFFA